MLNLIEARTSVAIDSAFGRLGTADDVTALIVLGSDFTWLPRERLASLAAAHRSPAIYGNRDSVLAGGLMSYGASLSDQFRCAASHTDRIPQRCQAGRPAG